MQNILPVTHTSGHGRLSTCTIADYFLQRSTRVFNKRFKKTTMSTAKIPDKKITTSINGGITQVAFKPENVNEQAIYSRAFNVAVWGMPAVNFELFIEALRKVKGDYNQIVYWSGLVKSNNQTLTPNPDVIYVNPFYDTRKGPVILEIPAADGPSSITGSLDDAWQTAIEDIGPAGMDKGKGGKYFIIPPGYKEKVPDGFIPMPSSTFTGFAILRSNLTDGSEKVLARAIEYGKKVKIYPYSQAATPPQTTFVDLMNVDYDTTITYN